MYTFQGCEDQIKFHAFVSLSQPLERQDPVTEGTRGFPTKRLHELTRRVPPPQPLSGDGPGTSHSAHHAVPPFGTPINGTLQVWRHACGTGDLRGTWRDKLTTGFLGREAEAASTGGCGLSSTFCGSFPSTRLMMHKIQSANQVFLKTRFI